MKAISRISTRVMLALGLALLVISVTISYLTIGTLVEDAREEAKNQEGTIVLERVVAQFRFTEALLRRYVLTAQPGDLVAYQKSRDLLANQLTALIGKDVLPTQSQDDIRPLRDLIAQRVQSMDLTAQARGEQGLEAAAARAGSPVNRQLDDEIDKLFGQIKNASSQSIAKSKVDTERSSEMAKRLILVSGLLSLLTFWWAISRLERAQRRQSLVEAQLTDSEAMSRAITDSMAEGLVTASADGVVVSANTAVRHMFGYRADELLGQKVTLLLPERYRMGFEAFFSTLPKREVGFREWDTKTLALRRDGVEFPVSVSFGDVNVGGRRLFTAIIHDITESQRITEALRNSEEQLRQLTDTVPALIAYVDAEQRFQFHNKAYQEVLGRTQAQIEGRYMADVLGPELYAVVEPHVREVLSGYSVRYERRQMTASGEWREYVMNYFPRYGEDAAEDQVIGFFALGNDVTELKRIDRMKSEFVSTVSHELRTPLTSIRGSLGLVMGGVAGQLPDKARALVDIARTNCERLIRLINDILDSEKIESGKVTFDLLPLDMQELLEQAISANEGFAMQHNVKVALKAEKFAVMVYADSDRLVQVVTNLLSNAIKFSPVNETVTVRLRWKAGIARVEVTDKGPGIPEEFRQRIFQKFSQADSSDTRQKGGTGLGLSISRAIVERMEGTMGFTTEIGVGTTFYFELPEWREAPAVSAPMSLFGGERPRILICEDDQDVAKLLALMLDGDGFDADIAHSPAQAREYLQMTAYAAMTMDIKLPSQNGLDFLRELRSSPKTRQLPVVVLSVTAAEARMQPQYQSLDVTDWLDKPINEAMLRKTIRRAVAKSRAA
ncbi:PAS domain S-box protein [Polaromonas sp. YR568]|uniref:PAS domain S-box protein n=1 Tax=Polaromonas sp. YR568 TaxID=1855301 RepID=UPI003137B327